MWAENEDDTIKRRFSRDGTSWSNVETLTPSVDSTYYNVETATARDGGGWAVWDHNGQGPVEASSRARRARSRTTGMGEKDCPLELKVGSATVVAREKCLQKVEGANKYKTTGDVRVNGIDLYTTSAGAGSAKSAAAATITIDRGAKTLMTEGKVEAKVGNVVLGRAQVKWKIPQDGGQILDLAGNPAVFETGDTRSSSWACPCQVRRARRSSRDGSVEIPVHLGLPEAVRWHGRAGRDHRRHRGCARTSARG